MTFETYELKCKADEGKYLYQIGKISREECRSMVEPYINLYNKKAVEIAKKYNMKPKKLSFIKYIR